MTYVAVKGGQEAIEASLKLLEYRKIEQGDQLKISAIEANMKLLVDQVMSEASLYAPNLAARALWQAEGSVEEAVFLLRAYRSTLERMGYSEIIDTSNEMQVQRRISAAFKDIPGGQMLGATYDYMHRLIDFSDEDEHREQVKQLLAEFRPQETEMKTAEIGKYEKVSAYLQDQGILNRLPENNTEPEDMTKKVLEFPTKRSERLQILSRGMAQSLMAFAYSIIRGYGDAHPTVGELRVGTVPVYYTEEQQSEAAYYLGKIEMTEAEMYIPKTIKKNGKEKMEIEIGYGFVYGRNETKAISMGILDYSLEEGNKELPTGDEEFVLYHIDSIESTGFLSHLKLPHYVTFQSKLDSIRKTQERGEE
ncbi:carbon-phosphorus lyase complex subunit PhnI [Candidatus Enterococcus murrayae]|uniref:Carbon-phosphorus lyase complex subunit PhnI n=1 Tax=Candidatus Enterococcus murrayae TaxID=2815321 RepID=A0ABS3HJ90_9ENTE|nr:carbon-phosphorus lyase complex subunit PhnI [Enterococcus sp. MJM16]MBO0453499.1 carbon-phosphorus lyase complex subunit PhnI [Enterococcus sp. MJM16]